MAGCFGSHPIDRWMERRLDDYLDGGYEEEENNKYGGYEEEESKQSPKQIQ